MSSGASWYYANIASEDYYLKGGEPPGIWWGLGASDLGLTGKVSSGELHALYKGFAPDGSAIVQNAGNKNRQVGWDLTFSAPKPASTLWSQSEPDVRQEIQAAHHEAVKFALGYLEEEVAITRRGKAGCEREAARLIVSLFEHGTSRELDPHLHTHALVINACKRKDGTMGTLMSKPLYQHKMVAGALYRAELAAQLEARLGVRCELAERGDSFFIEGVSKELNKTFSKRREAIEALLKSRGLDNAAAAAVAALDTRMKKGEIPPRDELFALWREVGKSLGFHPEQALGKERRVSNSPREFQKALEDSLQILTASQSHFQKRELLREVAVQAQARNLSGNFIRAEFRKALETSKEIRPLGEWAGEFRYTTQAVLDAEKQLIARADRLNSKRNHGTFDSAIDRAIVNAEKPLNSEQAEAVRFITRTGSGIRSVEGMAGTGKTTTLSVARAIFQEAGYTVIGATTSGKAARELADGAGIESYTIAMLNLMMSPSQGDKLKHHAWQIARAALHKPTFKLQPFRFDKKTVLILDEAAMIETRELAKLVAAVEKGGGMLVTVFDRKQLQAIGAGGGAAFLADRYGKSELSNIVRQRNPGDVEIVKSFAAGKAAEALQMMAEQGKVHVAKDRDSALAKLVTDWTVMEEGRREGSLIFVGTREEAGDANERCQSARLRSGEIGGQHMSMGSFSLYQGDRVLFTKNSKPLGVQNGTLGTIVELKPRRGIATVKLDTQERVQVPLKSYKSLQLGYAVTTHKGQGTTVNNSYILAGGSMQNRELTYVQASRARESTRLYTSKQEAGKKLENLAKQMAKTQEKTLAHDVLLRQEKGNERIEIKREMRM